jgi:beta-galactosidase
MWLICHFGIVRYGKSVQRPANAPNGLNMPKSGLSEATLSDGSRRALLRASVLGAAAVSVTALSRAGQAVAEVSAAGAPRTYNFNQNWLFGGRYVHGSEQPGYNDTGFSRVTIPHTVTPLPWSGWDPATWQQVHIYRKHFHRPGTAGSRVLLDLDGVMTNAAVVLNGKVVSTHQGGYLPWTTELTRHLRSGSNVLAIIVDSRWLHVPPGGSPRGPITIDYLQPGGITREAELRVIPQVFLADVFAKPVDVLSGSPAVEVQATVDAAASGPVRVTTELLDGGRVIGSASSTAHAHAGHRTALQLRISGFGGVGLWSPESPKLYTVRTTVSHKHGPAHTTQLRTGFRLAQFRVNGFELNGHPYKIFGLNRHQLFPYLGMAAPAGLQRRDAEILKSELHCNMVRCSHYPQSRHFLDACDQLGLMVWQETPGWGYVGNHAWQQIVRKNVRDMIIRDRSRASVIVWGTRLNETTGHSSLYTHLRRHADALDGSRQTAGATNKHYRWHWDVDVFGFDDYHHHNGRGTLRPPLAGVPYFVTEAVGSLDGSQTFRWGDPQGVLASQAMMHAEAHNQARSDERYAGLLGWSAIDYQSLNDAGRLGKVWQALKTSGVLDTFRVAKPGAAFYRSQVSPHVRPVILPVFWWDFGPGSPRHGPGKNAMIATNCDRLEIFVGGKHHTTARPDRRRFRHLQYPPAFANLAVGGATRPGLRIDGYVGSHKVATVRMSSDTRHDRLQLWADEHALQADGSDATRVSFQAVDQYGHHRPHVIGNVTLSVSGPATLVGDNPFSFELSGGVGGVFIRTLPGRTGTVHVGAQHPQLGHAGVRVAVHHARGRFL